MKKISLYDIGLKNYKDAWQLQEKLFKQTIDTKLANRESLPALQNIPENHFIICEHLPVITLGKSGEEKNLLFTETLLNSKGIEFCQSNRGGDVTAHNPGQLVGYPILDLDQFQTDIHKYLRALEEVIILTLSDYGIEGQRYQGYTGVWLDVGLPHKARKICAMGVRTSRWVTMHGFALNINNDLSLFDFIIPCGIKGKQVTSIQKELGKTINEQEVKSKILFHFQNIFEVTIAEKNIENIAK